MFILESDKTVFFDVDETLVLWDEPEEIKAKYGVVVGGPDFVQLVVPHFVHIQKMIEHKSRGHKVVVWSAGGWEWAKACVDAIKVEGLVDVIMGKPSWYVDDLKSSEFMPEVNRYWKTPAYPEFFKKKEELK